MRTHAFINLLSVIVIATGLFSCVSIPEGAEAVKSFDKEKYLGKWYEIARLDFKYERDLNNTTAEYSLNDNGTIKVIFPSIFYPHFYKLILPLPAP